MANQGFVVRLRGLPWSTTPEQIMEFLRDCEVDGREDGVHFTYSREGRPSGEAFVELRSEDDVQAALQQNNEHIGSRYIEVFRVDRNEMEWMIKRAGSNMPQSRSHEDAVVKLRGLPFGCTKEEIAHFFSGMEIVPNGIMLPADDQGRNHGEAFVQFASPEIAERSFEKDKERIGHRYIEIFKSDLNEANNMSRKMRGGIRPLMGPMGGRPGPYDRHERYGGGPMRGGFMGGRDDYDDFGGPGGPGFGGPGMGPGPGFGMRGRGGRGGPPMGPPMRGRGGPMGMRDRGGPGSQYMSKTGHSVHMRGLPFAANDQDVFDFFSPIQPVRCEFELNDQGRSTGEANVDFATHQEAVDAMKKHKCNMQHRYIELFLNSEPNMQRGGGGGGGYNNMGGGFGNNDGYGDEMGGGYNQGPNQGFGGNQGSFGNGGGFGNQGNNYMGGGGGYDGGMGNNYTAF